jgi:cell wall assembly regulator SMI1
MNSVINVLISSIVGIVVGLIVGFLTLILLTKGRILSQIKSSLISSKEGKPLNDGEISEIRDNLRNAENNINKNELTYKNWANHWESLLVSCQKHKAVGRWQEGTPRFVIEPPATEEEIAHIENILEHPIPDSFKRVLSTYSAKVNISWQLQSEDKPPEIFREIFSGECCWNLQELPELMETYRKWVDECFSDSSNLYDAVWHNKFPVAEVGNGDMIGIDIGEQFGAVFYLSHEDGAGHGYRMGNDFEDFINRIAQIGCVGYEDWQWLPFTSNKDSMIDPQSKNAEVWRKWFGLEISAKDA